MTSTNRDVEVEHGSPRWPGILFLILLVIAAVGGALVAGDEVQPRAPGVGDTVPGAKPPPFVIAEYRAGRLQCDAPGRVVAQRELYEDPHASMPHELVKSYLSSRYPESSVFNADITLETRLAGLAVFSARVEELTKAFFLVHLGADHWVLNRLEACPEVIQKEVIPLTQSASTKGMIAVSMTLPHISSTFSRVALVDQSGSIEQELYAFNGHVNAREWSPSGSRLLYSVDAVEGFPVYRIASFSDGTDVVVPGWSEGALEYYRQLIWIDDETLLGEDVDGLWLIEGPRKPVLVKTLRELSNCSPRADSCPEVTGLGVSSEGVVAIALTGGHFALLPEGLWGDMLLTRTPDGGTCGQPYFRPGGDRVGVTCERFLPSRSADFTATTKFAAWVVDLRSLEWFKIGGGEISYESSGRFFPWTPDARSYLSWGRSESPCSPRFQFLDSRTGAAVSPLFAGTFGSFAPDGRGFVYEGLDDSCEGGEGSGLYTSTLDGLTRRQVVSGVRGGLWSPAR